MAFSKYQLVPVYDSQPNTSKTALCSGGFRNVERGIWLYWQAKRKQNFCVAMPTSGMLAVPTVELNISKQL